VEPTLPRAVEDAGLECRFAVGEGGRTRQPDVATDGKSEDGEGAFDEALVEIRNQLLERERHLELPRAQVEVVPAHLEPSVLHAAHSLGGGLARCLLDGPPQPLPVHGATEEEPRPRDLERRHRSVGNPLARAGEIGIERLAIFRYEAHLEESANRQAVDTRLDRESSVREIDGRLLWGRGILGPHGKGVPEYDDHHRQEANRRSTQERSFDRPKGGRPFGEA